MFRALSPTWVGDRAIVLALGDFLSSWLPQGCLSEASPTVGESVLLRPEAVDVYPPKVKTLETQVGSGEQHRLLSQKDSGLDLR